MWKDHKLFGMSENYAQYDVPFHGCEKYHQCLIIVDHPEQLQFSAVGIWLERLSIVLLSLLYPNICGHLCTKIYRNFISDVTTKSDVSNFAGNEVSLKLKHLESMDMRVMQWNQLTDYHPTDGGYGWFIVLASFFANVVKDKITYAIGETVVGDLEVGFQNDDYVGFYCATLCDNVRKLAIIVNNGLSKRNTVPNLLKKMNLNQAALTVWCDFKPTSYSLSLICLPACSSSLRAIILLNYLVWKNFSNAFGMMMLYIGTSALIGPHFLHCLKI
ncbi:Monocarboxylate transporter [Dirofilaria immitis]